MAKRKRNRALAADWIEPAWSALARRLAAVAGSGSVVIALLVDVPLLPAVGRGALAWISVVGLFRLGGLALGSRPYGEKPDETDAPGPASAAPLAPVRAPAARER